MHRHIADQLDSVVGSQHKAFPLDSVHFSHCRGTQCENYYAIGLKKKKNPWLHAFQVSVDTAEGSNQWCSGFHLSGSSNSDSVAVLCLEEPVLRKQL